MRIKRYDENYIEFDNGTTIEAVHEQSCCENVYAECSYLSNYNIQPLTGLRKTIKEIDFKEDIENYIEDVPDEGFNLIDDKGCKWFVPCYDEQNGYYCSNLRLIIKHDKIKIEKDIEHLTKSVGYFC